MSMIRLPIKKLNAFFSKRRDVNTALIFGSFAKNRARKSSDVDIAVLLESRQPVSWKYSAKLSIELGDICHREVDVLILNQASPHIAFRAIQEGKILFQRSRPPWNQFVVKTISMNEDMEILYRKVGHG